MDDKHQLKANNHGPAGHVVIDIPHSDNPNTDNAEGNHVVVDIDGAGDTTNSSTVSEGSCCVVCMEPLEWAAVGRCGHRVVCSMCAARIRSGPRPDKRCCICRTLCSTVVISKKGVTSQDGRVGGEYWYYAAMSAYFNDMEHYKSTKQAVDGFLKTKQLPPPPSSCRNGVTRNLDASPARPAVSSSPENPTIILLFVLLYLSVPVVTLVAAVIFYTTG
uniref:RING-type domain-containing protein n=1 Tax=Oryza brachyantha TaxID=4533 RepID=J3L173_ORYBR